MFRLLALTLLTLPFTLADSDQYCPDSDYALEPEDAYDLAYNFGKLVSNYNSDLADNTLDPSFVDFSEGVNSMIDNGGDSPVSLLGPTFSSRTGFKDASSKQPSVPFRLKQVWVSCDWVTFRWESDQSPKPVVGISVGHAVPAPFGNLTPFRFDKVYGEFDSAAWLTNVGVLKQSNSKRAVNPFKARREALMARRGEEKKNGQ